VYHKRVLRGPDPYDRPKGYEMGKSTRKPQGVGKIEAEPISRRMGETHVTVYDGSVKTIIMEDKCYDHAIEIPIFSGNLQ
jgi:hypothetical protein